MNKTFTFLFIYLAFSHITHSQNIDWVKQIGGTSEDVILSVDTDANSNTYSTGYFANTSHFDEITLNSIGYFNGFVTKTDANGTILWAKSFGQPNDGDINDYHSVIPRSVAVDANGNVIITGYFEAGEFDADPGNGEFILTSNSYEMFIVKLDSNGEFIWATSFGATENSFENIYDVETDINGDVYVTGFYSGSISIDHAAGTDFISSKGSNDIFIMKFDASGYYSWMYSVGGPDSDISIDMEVTSNSEIYITGQYRDSATFYEPFFMGSPVILDTTEGYKAIFALKLDTNGNFINVIKIGEAESSAIGMSLAVGINNYVYLTGHYGGILTSNTGSSNEFNLNSDNNYEGFIAKVDFNNNNVKWIKEIDGANSSVYSFAVDTDSNNILHIAGFFGETLNVGSFNLTKQTTNAQENFLIAMNDSGDYLSAHQFGGLDAVDTQSLVIDDNDNIILGGSFKETVNISPFSSENISITSLGFRDNYILKLSNNTVLSTKTNILQTNFKIYPNPTSDYLIVSKNRLNKKLNYIIFDMNGKPILSGVTENKEKINLNTLSSGVYFLSINNQNTFKFLKK